MSSPADRVLQEYIKRFKQLPDQPNQLVSFSRTDADIPTIIYSEAKKTLTKIKHSIKTGKIKKKSFKTSTKWTVGDEVLISKDRTGLLKYIGKVPEMGDDKIYYGLELTSGTLGQNDGAVKGKRYFQTTGKRGMFVPERKLRRRLNKKDKERRNSYAEVSSQVKELQKSYAGDDAAWLYHGNSVTGQEQNLHSLVFETAQLETEEQHKYGNGRDSIESTDEAEEIITPKIKKVSKKNVKKTVKKSSKHKKKARRQRRDSQRSHSSHSSRYGKNDRSDRSSTESMSELDETESKDDPTVKTFDTLLKYILRQKGGYREGLLDVYANPQTHALIIEAFSQMKQLHPAEQAFLWPALLKRWSKYAHKI